MKTKIVDYSIAFLTVIIQYFSQGAVNELANFGITFAPWVGWMLMIATLCYAVALFFALPFYQRPQIEIIMGTTAASILGFFGFLYLFLYYQWHPLFFLFLLFIVCLVIIGVTLFFGSKTIFDMTRVRLSRIHKKYSLFLNTRFYTLMSLPLLVLASTITSWIIEFIIRIESYDHIFISIVLVVLFFLFFVYFLRHAIFPQERFSFFVWMYRSSILFFGIFIGTVV